MGYESERLWLDAADAERDERIGEHEGYVTLFDLANNRYLGNRLWWAEALESFLTNGLRDVVSARLRVVPRCHCDEMWCRGDEWTGPQLPIIEDRHGIIDFDATTAAAEQEWRGHVEELRAGIERHLAEAAKRRASHLVQLDEIAAMEPMERLGWIRTARGALDAVEIDAVMAARGKGRSWTELGVELGISRQAARERFMKYDPRGAEAA